MRGGRNVGYAAFACVWVLTGFGAPAWGAEGPDPHAREREAAWAAANAAMLRGPTEIKLLSQGHITLPDGYVFVPSKESAELMRVMGNNTDERLLGLIFATAEDKNWMVSVEFEKSGYIKDDDAKEWDADELLASLKEGTEAANEQRAEMGVTPIEVTRWIEKPAYDAVTHRLVWSAEAREKGGNDPDPTVNYNTYVLGREGYVSLNLITATSQIDADKTDARRLLAAVQFEPGKRYSDFDASTDKVAAYGLGALVAGAAAKKLGLLAALGALLAKFGKVLVVAAVAGGAALRKFLGRKSADSDTPAA